MSLRNLWTRYKVAEFNRAVEDEIPLWAYAVAVLGLLVIVLVVL